MSHHHWIGPPAIVLLLLACPPAWATPHTSTRAPRGGTLGTLMRLRNETVILKQDLKIAQLRAQIHKVRRPVMPLGEGALPTSGVRLLLPQIRSITGAEDRMEASLTNPDGSVQTVRIGSRLTTGGYVTRITSSTVWVALGRAPAQALTWIPESPSKNRGAMGAVNGLSPTANLRSLLLGTPGLAGAGAPAPFPVMPASSPAPASAKTGS